MAQRKRTQVSDEDRRRREMESAVLTNMDTLGPANMVKGYGEAFKEAATLFFTNPTDETWDDLCQRAETYRYARMMFEAGPQRKTFAEVSHTRDSK